MCQACDLASTMGVGWVPRVVVHGNPAPEWALFVLGGDTWPSADDAGMRAIGEIWGAIATEIGNSQSSLDGLARTLASQYGGETGQELRFAWHDLMGYSAEDGLVDLQHAALDMQMLSVASAADIAYAKATIVTQALVSAISIMYALMTSWLTLGISTAAIPGTALAGRQVVLRFFRQLLANLSSRQARRVAIREARVVASHGAAQTTRRTASTAATTAGRNAITGGGGGGAREWARRNLSPEGLRRALGQGAHEIGEEFVVVDALAQSYLVATGRQDGWNWEQSAISGLAGFLGGATSTLLMGQYAFLGLGWAQRAVPRVFGDGFLGQLVGRTALGGLRNGLTSPLSSYLASHIVLGSQAGAPGLWDTFRQGAVGGVMVGASRGGGTLVTSTIGQHISTGAHQINPQTGAVTARPGGPLDPANLSPSVRPHAAAVLHDLQQQYAAPQARPDGFITHSGVPQGAGSVTVPGTVQPGPAPDGVDAGRPAAQEVLADAGRVDQQGAPVRTDAEIVAALPIGPDDHTVVGDQQVNVVTALVDGDGNPVGSMTRVFGLDQRGTLYVEHVSTLVNADAVATAGSQGHGQFAQHLDQTLAAAEAAYREAGFTEVRATPGAMDAVSLAAAGYEFDVAANPELVDQLRDALTGALEGVRADPDRGAELVLAGLGQQVDQVRETDRALAATMLDAEIDAAQRLLDRIAGSGELPSAQEFYQAGQVARAALVAVEWSGVRTPAGTAPAAGVPGRTAEPVASARAEVANWLGDRQVSNRFSGEPGEIREIDGYAWLVEAEKRPSESDRSVVGQVPEALAIVRTFAEDPRLAYVVRSDGLVVTGAEMAHQLLAAASRQRWADLLTVLADPVAPAADLLAGNLRAVAADAHPDVHQPLESALDALQHRAEAATRLYHLLIAEGWTSRQAHSLATASSGDSPAVLDSAAPLDGERAAEVSQLLGAREAAEQRLTAARAQLARNATRVGDRGDRWELVTSGLDLLDTTMAADMLTEAMVADISRRAGVPVPLAEQLVREVVTARVAGQENGPENYVYDRGLIGDKLGGPLLSADTRQAVERLPERLVQAGVMPDTVEELVRALQEQVLEPGNVTNLEGAVSALVGALEGLLHHEPAWHEGLGSSLATARRQVAEAVPPYVEQAVGLLRQVANEFTDETTQSRPETVEHDGSQESEAGQPERPERSSQRLMARLREEAPPAPDEPLAAEPDRRSAQDPAQQRIEVAQAIAARDRELYQLLLAAGMSLSEAHHVVTAQPGNPEAVPALVRDRAAHLWTLRQEALDRAAQWDAELPDSVAATVSELDAALAVEVSIDAMATALARVGVPKHTAELLVDQLLADRPTVDGAGSSHAYVRDLIEKFGRDMLSERAVAAVNRLHHELVQAGAAPATVADALRGVAAHLAGQPDRDRVVAELNSMLTPEQHFPEHGFLSPEHAGVATQVRHVGTDRFGPATDIEVEGPGAGSVRAAGPSGRVDFEQILGEGAPYPPYRGDTAAPDAAGDNEALVPAPAGPAAPLAAAVSQNDADHVASPPSAVVTHTPPSLAGTPVGSSDHGPTRPPDPPAAAGTAGPGGRRRPSMADLLADSVPASDEDRIATEAAVWQTLSAALQASDEGGKVAGLQLEPRRRDDDSLNITVERNETTVRLDVYEGPRGKVGEASFTVERDRNGDLIVRYVRIELTDSPHRFGSGGSVRRRGFLRSLHEFLESWGRESGLSGFEVLAENVAGALPWIRLGFTPAQGTGHQLGPVETELRRARDTLQHLLDGGATTGIAEVLGRPAPDDPAARDAHLRHEVATIDSFLARAERSEPGLPGYPSLSDVSRTDVGQRVLWGARMNLVKPLDGSPVGARDPVGDEPGPRTDPAPPATDTTHGAPRAWRNHDDRGSVDLAILIEPVLGAVRLAGRLWSKLRGEAVPPSWADLVEAQAQLETYLAGHVEPGSISVDAIDPVHQRLSISYRPAGAQAGEQVDISYQPQTQPSNVAVEVAQDLDQAASSPAAEIDVRAQVLAEQVRQLRALEAQDGTDQQQDLRERIRASQRDLRDVLSGAGAGADAAASSTAAVDRRVEQMAAIHRGVSPRRIDDLVLQLRQALTEADGQPAVDDQTLDQVARWLSAVAVVGRTRIGAADAPEQVDALVSSYLAVPAGQVPDPALLQDVARAAGLGEAQVRDNLDPVRDLAASLGPALDALGTAGAVLDRAAALADARVTLRVHTERAIAEQIHHGLSRRQARQVVEQASAAELDQARADVQQRVAELDQALRWQREEQVEHLLRQRVSDAELQRYTEVRDPAAAAPRDGPLRGIVDAIAPGVVEFVNTALGADQPVPGGRGPVTLVLAPHTTATGREMAVEVSAGRGRVARLTITGTGGPDPSFEHGVIALDPGMSQAQAQAYTSRAIAVTIDELRSAGSEQPAWQQALGDLDLRQPTTLDELNLELLLRRPLRRLAALVEDGRSPGDPEWEAVRAQVEDGAERLGLQPAGATTGEARASNMDTSIADQITSRLAALADLPGQLLELGGDLDQLLAEATAQAESIVDQMAPLGLALDPPARDHLARVLTADIGSALVRAAAARELVDAGATAGFAEQLVLTHLGGPELTANDEQVLAAAKLTDARGWHDRLVALANQRVARTPADVPPAPYRTVAERVTALLDAHLAAATQTELARAELRRAGLAPPEVEALVDLTRHPAGSRTVPYRMDRHSVDQALAGAQVPDGVRWQLTAQLARLQAEGVPPEVWNRLIARVTQAPDPPAAAADLVQTLPAVLGSAEQGRTSLVQLHGAAGTRRTELAEAVAGVRRHRQSRVEPRLYRVLTDREQQAYAEVARGQPATATASDVAGAASARLAMAGLPVPVADDLGRAIASLGDGVASANATTPSPRQLVEGGVAADTAQWLTDVLTRLSAAGASADAIHAVVEHLVRPDASGHDAQQLAVDLVRALDDLIADPAAAPHGAVPLGAGAAGTTGTAWPFADPAADLMSTVAPALETYLAGVSEPGSVTVVEFDHARRRLTVRLRWAGDPAPEVVVAVTVTPDTELSDVALAVAREMDRVRAEPATASTTTGSVPDPAVLPNPEVFSAETVVRARLLAEHLQQLADLDEAGRAGQPSDVEAQRRAWHEQVASDQRAWGSATSEDPGQLADRLATLARRLATAGAAAGQPLPSYADLQRQVRQQARALVDEMVQQEGFPIEAQAQKALARWLAATAEGALVRLHTVHGLVSSGAPLPLADALVDSYLADPATVDATILAQVASVTGLPEPQVQARLNSLGDRLARVDLRLAGRTKELTPDLSRIGADGVLVERLAALVTAQAQRRTQVELATAELVRLGVDPAVLQDLVDQILEPRPPAGLAQGTTAGPVTLPAATPQRQADQLAALRAEGVPADVLQAVGTAAASQPGQDALDVLLAAPRDSDELVQLVGAVEGVQRQRAEAVEQLLRDELWDSTWSRYRELVGPPSAGLASVMAVAVETLRAAGLPYTVAREVGSVLAPIRLGLPAPEPAGSRPDPQRLAALGLPGGVERHLAGALDDLGRAGMAPATVDAVLDHLARAGTAPGRAEAAAALTRALTGLLAPDPAVVGTAPETVAAVPGLAGDGVEVAWRPAPADAVSGEPRLRFRDSDGQDYEARVRFDPALADPSFHQDPDGLVIRVPGASPASRLTAGHLAVAVATIRSQGLTAPWPGLAAADPRVEPVVRQVRLIAPLERLATGAVTPEVAAELRREVAQARETLGYARRRDASAVAEQVHRLSEPAPGQRQHAPAGQVDSLLRELARAGLPVDAAARDRLAQWLHVVREEALVQSQVARELVESGVPAAEAALLVAEYPQVAGHPAGDALVVQALVAARQAADQLGHPFVRTAGEVITTLGPVVTPPGDVATPTFDGPLTEHRPLLHAVAAAVAADAAQQGRAAVARAELERLGIDPALAEAVVAALAEPARTATPEGSSSLPQSSDELLAQASVAPETAAALLDQVVVLQQAGVPRQIGDQLVGWVADAAHAEAAAAGLVAALAPLLDDTADPRSLTRAWWQAQHRHAELARDVHALGRERARRGDHVLRAELSDSGWREHLATVAATGGTLLDGPLPPPTGDTTPAGLQAGVPIERLPGMVELAEHLNQGLDGRDQVTADELDGWLRAEYRDVISADGVIRTFGYGSRREFHLRLRLTDPRPMPPGFRDQYQPGEQSQRSLGQGLRGMTHFVRRASLRTFEWGSRAALAVLPAPSDVRVTLTNRLDQFLGAKQYAESGLGVLNNRGPATTVRAKVVIEVTERDPVSWGFERTKVISPGRRLKLDVPDPYLDDPPATTTIDSYPNLTPREHYDLPHLVALRMTGKEPAIGEILRIIRDAGHPLTDSLQEQTRLEVDALPDSFMAAVRNRDGRHFVINDNGRQFQVQHQAEIQRAHAEPLGSPSNEINLEQVGVGWGRSAGSAAVGHQRGLAVEPVDGTGVSAGQSASNAAVSERDSIRVSVDRDTSYKQAWTLGDQDDPDRTPGVVHQFAVYDMDGTRLGTATVNGAAVIVMSEKDGWEYNLPVATEAVGEDGQLTRGLPTTDETQGQRAYPEHLIHTTTGPDGDQQTQVMVGIGTVRDFHLRPSAAAAATTPAVPGAGQAVRGDGDGISELRRWVINQLAAEGYVFDVHSVSEDPAGDRSPGKKVASRLRVPTGRELQLENYVLLEQQLTQSTLETRWDELVTNGLKIRVARFDPTSASGTMQEREVVLRLNVDGAPAHVGDTSDRQNVQLEIDSFAGGTARSRARDLSGSFGTGVEGTGFSFGAGRGAAVSSNVSQRGNVVHLFEHSGEVGAWQAGFTLSAHVQDTSGGNIARAPELAGNVTIYLPTDFADTPREPGDEGVTTPQTPEAVFRPNTATVASVWAPGLVDAARGVLPSLTEEWGVRDLLQALSDVDMNMATIKEMVSTGIHNDQLFRARFGPHQRGAVRLGAELGETRLVGTTGPGVTGHFMFRMASHFVDAERSWNVEGAASSELAATGSAGGSRGKGRLRALGRIFGLERIPISTEERRFLFVTDTTFKVDGTTVTMTDPAGNPITPSVDTATDEVSGEVSWLLAESDAIDAYGKGELNLPAADVRESLNRAQAGEVTIDPQVVARATLRLAEGGSAQAPRDLLVAALTPYEDVVGLDQPIAGAPPAELVNELHRIVHHDPGPPSELRQLQVPEHIKHGLLGMSGIESLDVRAPDGADANRALVDLVERIVPGATTGLSGDVPAPVGNMPGLRQIIDALTAGDRLRGPLDSMLDGNDWHPLWVGEVPHGRLRGFAEKVTIEGKVTMVPTPVVRGRRDGSIVNQVYDYREEIRVDRLSGDAAGSLSGDGEVRDVAGGAEAGTGRGRNSTAVRSGQHTRIGLQEAADPYKVDIGVKVEFRVRREPVPGLPVNNAHRVAHNLSQSGGATEGTVELAGHLSLLVPKAMVTESPAPPAAPATARGRLGWLPDRHGTDGVQGEPIRRRIMQLLRDSHGRAGDEFEMDVKHLFSADQLRAGLKTYTHEHGVTVLLDQQLRQPYSERTAEVNVRMAFTELTVLRELDEMALGAENRWQDLLAEVEDANRARPAQGSFGADEDRFGGRAAIGERSGVGLESASGIRQEEGGRGKGPVVELRLRYSAAIQVTALGRGLVGRLVQLGKPAPGIAEGYVYLRVFKHDLPEIKRRMEQADTSFEPPDSGTQPSAEVARATGAPIQRPGEAGEASKPVRDRGRRQYQELLPDGRPRRRLRRGRWFLAAAGLLAGTRGTAVLEQHDPTPVPASPEAEVDMLSVAPAAPDDPVIIELPGEPVEPATAAGDAPPRGSHQRRRRQRGGAAAVPGDDDRDAAPDGRGGYSATDPPGQPDDPGSADGGGSVPGHGGVAAGDDGQPWSFTDYVVGSRPVGTRSESAPDAQVAGRIREQVAAEFRGLDLGGREVWLGDRFVVKEGRTWFEIEVADPDGTRIGTIEMRLHRYGHGGLRVDYDRVDVSDLDTWIAFNSYVESRAREAGSVELSMPIASSYWRHAALIGLDFTPSGTPVAELQQRLRVELTELLAQLAQAADDTVVGQLQQLAGEVEATLTRTERFQPGTLGFPSPYEIMQLGRSEQGTDAETWLGSSLLKELNWFGVKRLSDPSHEERWTAVQRLLPYAERPGHADATIRLRDDARGQDLLHTVRHAMGGLVSSRVPPQELAVFMSALHEGKRVLRRELEFITSWLPTGEQAYGGLPDAGETADTMGPFADSGVLVAFVDELLRPASAEIGAAALAEQDSLRQLIADFRAAYSGALARLDAALPTQPGVAELASRLLDVTRAWHLSAVLPASAGDEPARPAAQRVRHAVTQAADDYVAALVAAGDVRPESLADRLTAHVERVLEPEPIQHYKLHRDAAVHGQFATLRVRLLSLLQGRVSADQLVAVRDVLGLAERLLSGELVQLVEQLPRYSVDPPADLMSDPARLAVWEPPMELGPLAYLDIRAAVVDELLQPPSASVTSPSLASLPELQQMVVRAREAYTQVAARLREALGGEPAAAELVAGLVELSRLAYLADLLNGRVAYHPHASFDSAQEAAEPVRRRVEAAADRTLERIDRALSTLTGTASGVPDRVGSRWATDPAPGPGERAAPEPADVVGGIEEAGGVRAPDVTMPADGRPDSVVRDHEVAATLARAGVALEQGALGQPQQGEGRPATVQEAIDRLQRRVAGFRESVEGLFPRADGMAPASRYPVEAAEWLFHRMRVDLDFVLTHALGLAAEERHGALTVTDNAVAFVIEEFREFGPEALTLESAFQIWDVTVRHGVPDGGAAARSLLRPFVRLVHQSLWVWGQSLAAGSDSGATRAIADAKERLRSDPGADLPAEIDGQLTNILREASQREQAAHQQLVALRDVILGAGDVASAEWARLAYERFRLDDRDVEDIARNVAFLGFSRADIAQVKRYLFRRQHVFGEAVDAPARGRFATATDIAEAWIRLRAGRVLPADIVLVAHERAESTYVREHPDATYEEAHAFANQHADWEQARPGHGGAEPRSRADLAALWPPHRTPTAGEMLDVATTEVAGREASVSPYQIRFTRRSINPMTGRGLTVHELAERIQAGSEQVEPIQVVQWGDGSYTALDDQRLWAARRAGLAEVPVVLHSPGEQLPASQPGPGTSRPLPGRATADIRELDDGTLAAGGERGQLRYPQGTVAATFGEYVVFQAVADRSLLPGHLYGTEVEPVLLRRPPPPEPVVELSEDEAGALHQLRADGQEQADRIMDELGMVGQVVADRLGLVDPVQLLGAERRVKEFESLARKYHDAARVGGSDVEQFVAEVNDVVRFSLELPDGAGYQLALDQVLAELQSRGYQVIQGKNFWRPGNRYLGVNTTLVSPARQTFELQFHTSASWHAKELTTRQYAVLRRGDELAPRRVHALLQTFAVNKQHGLAGTVLPGTETMPEPSDTSFAAWVRRFPATWQAYQEWLADNDLDFREVVRDFGLDVADLGTEVAGDQLLRDLSDEGWGRPTGGAVRPGGEDGRRPVVGSSGEGLGVRPSSGAALPGRSAAVGPDPASQPGESRGSSDGRHRRQGSPTGRGDDSPDAPGAGAATGELAALPARGTTSGGQDGETASAAGAAAALRDTTAELAGRLASALAAVVGGPGFAVEQAGDAVAVTVDTGYGPTAAVTLWARVDPGVNNVTHAWPPDGPLVRLPVTEDLTAAVEHLRDTATGLAVVGRIVAWFDSDPPLPADSGYGEHGGASGRPDWRARGLARVGEPLAAVAGRLGIGNAAALLRHYLGNSGADYVVDPDQLVQDVVVLGNEVEVAVRRELEQVAVYAGDNDAYERPLPLDTGWRRIAMSDLSRLDWKLALGSFYYRVTGTATVRPAVEGGRPTVDMDYRIHVFDHYFWTRGGSLPVGSLQIPVDALGELRRQGVAHEFRVRGSTELRRYTGELPLPAQGPAVTGNPQLAATGYEPGSITQALAPVPITGQYSPGAQAGGSEQPGR